MDQIPSETASFEEQIKKSLSNAYDIERELGGGGMSRVFVATDRLLGRKIVIKFLSPELIAEVNRGRFRREIQVAAQLQHPHIVTLLSAGEDNDLVYYTMPYIDGESLRSSLDKNGRLTVPDVIRVLYDVVDALAYAHAHGVVHRDIKPANILRSGSHALVTDFGVAKALNAARSASALTSTGMAIGTPAYMAPEQLAGDTDADHRVDIYALGLLAYELLCGESPFAATSAQGVLAAVLTRDPKPLYLVRKDVPRKLSTIIMQCLSKVPGGRPPTAEALLDSLDMIATASGEIRTKEHKVPSRERTAPLPQMATPARASTGPVSTSLLIDHEPEKSGKRFFIPALAAVVIAGAASVFWFTRNPHNSPDLSIQPPASVAAEPGNVPPAPGAAGAAANAATGPTPAITPVDTAAIAASVQNRIAQMVAAASAKPGAAPVNTDSLKKKLRKELTDSIARANAARIAAAPPTTSVTQPTATAAQPAAAPAPAPAPVAAAPAPVSSGKRRVAITEPKGLQDQPVLSAFTHQFIDALHASLDNGESFAAVDQDSVRNVIAHTSSRDEAARVLKPDVLISPSYVGTGETVNILVTVWDLRSNSSYGIRVTSTKLEPSKPELYLGSLVQSVMKQLDDLNRTPTIYTKH